MPPSAGTGTAPELSRASLKTLFQHEARSPQQLNKITAINALGEELAAKILENTPTGAEQFAAIYKVREACWMAALAIGNGRET